MKTVSRILAFLKGLIELWNSTFSQPAREEQEKQKGQAERDNEDARADAAQKANRERGNGLREIQKKGGNDW